MQWLELQSAYETLVDPTKRRIYDQYGDQGVDMMNQVQSGDPEVLHIITANNLEIRVPQLKVYTLHMYYIT